MVGIYKYECGLKFTGIVAQDEEQAWAYLDKTHGEDCDKHYTYPVNRNCFRLCPIYVVHGDE